MWLAFWACLCPFVTLFMAPALPIVKFTASKKRYGQGPLILDGINLSVTPGDLVTLIGPSGCGKSTILKLVAGLNPVTEGALEVLGTKPRLARDRQAFIF